MATFLGKDGSFSTAAGAVGELKAFTINETSETGDTTSKGDTYRTRTAGLLDWSGSLEAHSDEEDATQAAATVGSTIVITAYPEKSEATQVKLSGSAIVTSTTWTSPEGSEVSNVSISFVGTGALTRAAAP